MSEHVCVVGNGPLSEDDKKNIEKCDMVYRFNDLKNYKDGDKIDVHVMREWENTHKYSGEHMVLNTPKCYVGMHAKEDAQSDTECIIQTNGIRSLNVFTDCTEPHQKRISRNPSTGTMLLSELQKNEQISSIDVYGMNWAFGILNHADEEANLIGTCCTKCNINKTHSDSYKPN